MNDYILFLSIFIIKIIISFWPLKKSLNLYKNCFYEIREIFFNNFSDDDKSKMLILTSVKIFKINLMLILLLLIFFLIFYIQYIFFDDFYSYYVNLVTFYKSIVFYLIIHLLFKKFLK